MTCLGIAITICAGFWTGDAVGRYEDGQCGIWRILVGILAGGFGGLVAGL